MKELNLLKQLQSTQGNIAKVDFVKDNLHKSDFIKTLRFLLDPLVTTNISRAKWNKASEIPNESIEVLDELLKALESCTGKNEQVGKIKYFINSIQDKTLKEVLEGVANKDFKTNFGLKMWEEVFPDDKIKGVVYCGCQAYSNKKLDELLEEGELIAEVKNDGQFIYAFVTENYVKFKTRKGKSQIINGQLVDELKRLRLEKVSFDFVLNGELLIKDYANRDEANGLIRGIASSNEKIEEGNVKERDTFVKKNGISIDEIESRLQYVVWDLIPMDKYKDGEDLTPYEIRSNNLEYVTDTFNSKSIKKTGSRIVKSKEEVFRYFYEMLDLRLEGIVLKSKKSVFKDGKAKSNLKFKIQFDCELRIVGFSKGKDGGKYKDTLGSLECSTDDGLLKTGVGGISEILRDEIWNNQSEWLGKIITVKCNGTSKNSDNEYSLRYANFKVDRSHEKDKTDRLEDIIEIEKYILELGGK
jgi:hypothetical protein